MFLKGLHFDGIAVVVSKKHNGLFTRCALETNIGLNDKRDTAENKLERGPAIPPHILLCAILADLYPKEIRPEIKKF